MTTSEFASRTRLVDAIVEFLGSQDRVPVSDARADLERQVDEAGPDAVTSLKARLTADNGWDFYPRDPLAQGIHHRLADRFLTRASDVEGVQHLQSLAGQPVILFSNHLSYADANVIEVLLQRSGAAEVANRLTALAGPKVFTSRQRRFSSLCFGTVKVPQSTEVSSEEAVLNARDVAKAARRSISVALDRLRAGDALLLFGEGTRSRTAAMQPLLPGVARYLDVPGTWVVPVGLSGSEMLFAVDDSKLRPAHVAIRVGRPLRADDLLTSARGARGLVMHAIGLAIADVVPASYRGVYGQAETYADARQVLQGLRPRSERT
jgi:1-acyl-sn-glycerol-3-phosphate acyltransferase